MRTLGLSHFLSKPITEQSLRLSVSRALDPQAPNLLEPVVVSQSQVADYRRQLLGKQILLAEDNRMNQQLIVEFLSQVGVSITLADNGRQAVELMSKQQFDAILMDLQMPILDGNEATRQIRKRHHQHDIPIIALTASAMRGDREISLNAGMNSYVTKPVDRFALYQALVAEIAPNISEPSRVPETLAPDHKPDPKPELQTEQQTEKQTQLLANAAARAQFLDRQPDNLWQLTAFMASKDWPRAQQLMAELAQQAAELRLIELADQARLILQILQQPQRPSAEQLNRLKDCLRDKDEAN